MHMEAKRTWVALVLAAIAVGCGDDGSTEGGSGTDSASVGSASSAGSTDSLSGGTSGVDTSESTTETSGTTDPSTSTTDPSTTGETTSGAESTDTGDTGEGSSSSGGMVVNDDPFDPASCGGTPFTEADAMAALNGMDRQVLATATIQIRERTCPGGDCGDWGEAYDWVISYLTWSGGVVTAYKDFQADMQLVVFDDQGTARLSLQHVTFDLPSSTYEDADGMVYDLPPTPITFPHVRAYDSAPDFDYYYQELDWLVRDGTLSVGEDCVRWVADPYVQQPPFTEQYAVVFHW